MKNLIISAAIALAAMTGASFADVPEGCTQVIANWATAPVYSCPIVERNNAPFCEREGNEHKPNCKKCGNKV